MVLGRNYAGDTQEDGDVTATDAAGSRGLRVLVTAGALAGLLYVAGLVVAVSAGDGAAAAHRGEARAGNFAYVVHRVETTDVIADPEFPEHNVTAAGQFVVVKLTATNVSGHRQTLRTAYDTVFDGNTEYGVDDAAWRYVGAARVDVGPGKSIDAAVVFDVPKGVDLDAIVLRDGRFAESVAVAL
jgi:Domain of unknown function (DUF4352)